MVVHIRKIVRILSPSIPCISLAKFLALHPLSHASDVANILLFSKYTGPRTKEIIIEIPTEDPEFAGGSDGSMSP
jgi:hypothetical protein